MKLMDVRNRPFWYEVFWRYPWCTRWHIYDYQTQFHLAQKSGQELQERRRRYYVFDEVRIVRVYRSGRRVVVRQEGR